MECLEWGLSVPRLQAEFTMRDVTLFILQYREADRESEDHLNSKDATSA